jgi:hypothetical protein
MAQSPDNQVSEFIAKAEPIINGPQTPAPNPNAPLVPFQTDLRLTREQEKKMIEHAFRRKQQLENESGRDRTIDPTWWNAAGQGVNTALASQGLQPSETFLGKRSRYDATFANDVSWRPYTFGPDNIFYSSNIPVPVVRRVCRQMIARAKNAFFGTDPWFSIDPAPVPEYDPQNDAERADRIEKFCRFKLGESQSDSKASSGRAISRALILGECPVKTSYTVRDQIFETTMTVLHDVDGQPVRAGDGNYITQNDQWVDAQDGLGTMILKRTQGLPPDQWTVEPVAPLWEQITAPKRQVLFEGTESEPIYYKDFLCPLTAKDEQVADTVVHLYDKVVVEFVDLVVKRGLVDDTAEDRIAAAQKMLALINQLNSNSPLPKSAQNVQTRPGDNFISGVSVETGGPISEFAEFYMHFDCNGDGIAESVMLICDVKSQAPIFYDYVSNVTTDGLRPIKVVRVNPVEGRWYGVGIFELFESYQQIIDLLVNRWNFSQSRAGRVDFWRPTDTQEGDRNPNLTMNWGSTYTIKPGVDPDGVLVSKYLTDIKFDQIRTMIEFFLQLLTAESGVSNANDAQMAGLESSNLATGINQIQQSGEELTEPMLQDLKPGIEAVLTREISVTLANMNPIEVFTYLEGQTEGIDRLTPDDVRGLVFKVKIELDTRNDQQKIQLSTAAASLVERFYMLAPQVQQKVAYFYQDQVRRMCPNCDVKKVIQPVNPTGPEPEAPKKSVTLSIKGEQLTPAQLDEALRENYDVESEGAMPLKTQDAGSVEKLGEPAPATEFSAQLSQRVRRKAAPR